MELCAQCYLQGYCRWLRSRAVTKIDLTPAFLRDLRAYALGLNIKPDRWKDFLLDAYRDYAGLVVDRQGHVVSLDTGVFDAPHIRTWFRDFACTPLISGVVPRLRSESVPRVIVMASILQALDPVRASLWGKVIANDDVPSLAPANPFPAERDCPYPRILDGGGVLAAHRDRTKL